MNKPLISFFRDLTDFILPRYCLICSEKLVEAEKHICTSCLATLPYTDFHRKEVNEAEKRLRARFPFERAASFLFFDKEGGCRKLIHAIKYKQEKEAGEYFGLLYGEQLSQVPVFTTTDIIIPVPLHRKKERKRGYNQSEAIAAGIARKLGKPLATHNLVKTRDTESQTLHPGGERWENIRDSFGLNAPRALENKHILLVDDVLTTGATIDACGRILSQIPEVRISVATLAIAEN